MCNPLPQCYIQSVMIVGSQYFARIVFYVSLAHFLACGGCSTCNIHVRLFHFSKQISGFGIFIQNVIDTFSKIVMANIINISTYGRKLQSQTCICVANV